MYINLNIVGENSKLKSIDDEKSLIKLINL